MVGESGRPVTATAQPAAEDRFEFSVATAPSTARHRQLAFAVVIATIVAFVVIAANAATPLPQINSFIPSVYAIIFVTDLVTAVLLYSQFSATGSRPLLVLASGYLFSGLIIVGHALTFPGAFTPTGLLGAGPQSSAWLNILWRFGLGASIAGYAVLRSGRQANNANESSPRSAISWSVAIVIVVVCTLIYAVTAGHALLPPALLDGKMLPLAHYANGVIALTNLLALLLLLASTRARSILDLWLLVATFALLAESTMITFFIQARFSFGFYAIRIISAPISKVVLIVLLWETMRLYANLAISNRELRRERANRLTNAAAGLAALAHEIRQPLTGINLTASAGQKMLDRASPDVSTAKELFGEIRDAAFRANEVFASFLRLFRGDDEDRRAVDVNALILEAIRLLHKNLEDHDVIVRTKLESDSPLVQGHAGQLREVILNLIQNAIDAMASTTNGPRVINIVTSRLGDGAIFISLQDTGPGIEPQNLASIFDPFVTTKAEGIGLGLAICKMIVEHHGGKLSAASDENGGARFEMTLPTRTAEPAAPAAPREQSDPLQKIH